jgi:hypothetical protein
MKFYRVTVDEHNATTYLNKIAAWQPVAGLEKVIEHLAEYEHSYGFTSGPPPAEAILEQLQDPEQRLLTGGPQFPGLPEARFTIYPYPQTQPDVMHTVSIIELGEPLQLLSRQVPLPASPADTVDFFQLSINGGTEERAKAWAQVWKQITTAAGSEMIRIGWAGMSPAEAMQQVGGRLQRQGVGTAYLYSLADADLQTLLNLVEHPPGADEMAPGGGGLWQREDEEPYEYEG